jgi:hypothetical protein
MPVPVTALYAALLGLVAFALASHVGRMRGAKNVSLGDGGDTALLEAMRRQMNFVENVPLILVLMALTELNGAPKSWLHGIGIVLLVARIVHPFGLTAAKMTVPARFVGAAGTMLVLLALIAIALWQVLWR